MDEEKTQEENGAANDSGEGDKQETTSLVDDANLAAKRLEDATKEMRAENDRREDLIARQMLGGSTEAGQPTEKKEESDKEYAEKAMSGELDPQPENGK